MSETRELISAGGVVVRPAGDGWETLVLHRISPDEWRLPKGKMHTGETLEETASREVAEETGLPAELGSYICATSYAYSTRRDGHVNKTVHYYLMRVGAQAPLQLEARNFDVRKQLLEYDDVSNDQRNLGVRATALVKTAREIDIASGCGESGDHLQPRNLDDQSLGFWSAFLKPFLHVTDTVKRPRLCLEVNSLVHLFMEPFTERGAFFKLEVTSHM